MPSEPRSPSGTRTRRAAVGALVGALVLFAAACSGDDAGSSPDTTGATASSTSTIAPPETSTEAATFSQGAKYVALGTSIASGYGISVQSTSCGRSNRNYPNLVAAELGLELTDVSCGAATIPNVVDTAQGDNPPQLAAVTPDTELITVTVGGNDILYNGTAVGCGDPATVCTAPDALEENLAATRTALASMFDQIRDAAPSAVIVFVTYPREVPDGNCPDLGFTDDEAAVVRSMGEQLEALFVEVVADEDVVFVDPYVAPGDHTGCAPVDERWTAGNVADDGFAYHPTALGHEVMAQMIVDALGA